MNLRTALPVAVLLVAACAANPADRYEAPPDDGSVVANSADSVTEPAVIPSTGRRPSSRDGADVVDAPSAKPAPKAAPAVDPVTGEALKASTVVGHYGPWEVRFNDAKSAERFAALPKARRAQLAAAQVLAAQSITNGTCPMTRAPLTADAVPVPWNGGVIGFSDASEANAFRTMAPDAQAAVIDAWRTGAPSKRGAAR